MWLSLISTASSRPKRWLTPPPQRTAYFSSARRPGVVLRVSAIARRVPGDRVDAGRASRWRCPHRRPSRLSAVRSAGEDRPRAGPSTRASTRPGGDAGRRPPRRSSIAIARIEQPEGRERRRRGRRRTPAARATRRRAARGVGRRSMASVVRSPARPRSSASAARTSGSYAADGAAAGSSRCDRQRAHLEVGGAARSGRRASRRRPTGVAVRREPSRTVGRGKSAR